jgi:hypothetical protein
VNVVTAGLDVLVFTDGIFRRRMQDPTPGLGFLGKFLRVPKAAPAQSPNSETPTRPFPATASQLISVAEP